MNKPPVRWIRYLARFLMLGLFIFELLNWSRILEYSSYYTWRGLVFTTIVVVAMVEIGYFILKKKYDIRLKNWVYLVVVFQLYFDALGDTFHMYEKSWYDQVAHFMGGFFIMLIIWQIMHQLHEKKILQLKLKGQLLFAMSLTWTLGVAYELEEYIEDLIFGSNRLGDGFDTANDMLMNGSGSLIMLFIILIIFKIKTSKNNQR